MRPGIIVDVTVADRDRLEAIVADRNSPQKHVWRAAIVLATVRGLGTNEVMRLTAKSKTCVWRWQERFAAEGVEGLLRDKTRPSRIAPFGPEVAERIVALTLATRPDPFVTCCRHTPRSGAGGQLTGPAPRRSAAAGRDDYGGAGGQQHRYLEMGGIFKTALAGWWSYSAMSLGAANAFFTVFSLAPMLLVAIAVAGMAFGRE